MKLAAVIPHFETPTETARCLAALEASERRVDQIIVVDNGSRVPLAGALRSNENLGFSGGCNLGIRRALDDGAAAVLILNSDTELAPDCLARLESALADETAIVGPAVVDMSPEARLESLG